MKTALIYLIIILGVFIASHSDAALESYWVCGSGSGSGSWDDGSCWSSTEGGPGGAGQPMTGEAVMYSGQIHYDLYDYPQYPLERVFVSGDASLVMSNWHPLEADVVQINEQGRINHYRGTSTINNYLLVGHSGAGSGRYLLGSSGSVSAGFLRVGIFGTGEFFQDGGSVNVDHHLAVGFFEGSTGFYELYHGTLHSNDYVAIGHGGEGIFTQHGGIHSTSGDLYIGYSASAQGTYDLNGGTLDVTGAILDHEGNGTLNVNGGTLNVGSGLIVVDNLNFGTQSGHIVTHSISTGEIYAGSLSVGSAALTQTGGSAYATELEIGTGFGSSGSYEMSGTGSLRAENVTIGRWNGAGTFTQSGGEVIIGEEFSPEGGSLYIGKENDYGISSSYHLSGGSLQANNEYIGTGIHQEHGTGSFVQTGGTNTTGQLIISGGYSGTSSYTLSNGSLNADFIVLGPNGHYEPGEFIQTGGHVNATTGIHVAAGTYTMSGGLLTGGIGTSSGGTFTATGGDLSLNNGIGVSGGEVNLSGTGTKTASQISISDGGTFNITDTTIEVAGGLMMYAEGGAYISTNSDNYFGHDIDIHSFSYIVGGANDTFHMAGNFYNSAMKEALWDPDTGDLLWDTDDAYLAFISGENNYHQFGITGDDIGAIMDGYTNNFAWGTLSIENNNELELTDWHDISGALYVGSLLGIEYHDSQVLNIYGNGLNIYYDAAISDNDYLGGRNYNLMSGGQLIAVNTPVVPEPVSSTLFVVGSAVLGFRRFKKTG